MFDFFRTKPDLKTAIAALNRRRTDANNLAFQNVLVQSILYLAAEQVPSNWNGVLVLDEEITLPVLTSAAPDGGVVLLCFSDVAEVRARSGKDHCFGLNLRDINNLVTRSGYAGIVVNPSGPWAALSAAELDVLAARVKP